MKKRYIWGIIIVCSLLLGVSLGVVTHYSAEHQEAEARTMEGKNILLIPLDSRPVNTSYISLLAEMVNANLFYPKEGLDHYLQPADYEMIKQFLVDHIQMADVVFIGVPQWLNGSIIENRHLESYLQNGYRLQELKEIIKQYPHKKIYLIEVIPREFPSYALDSYQYQFPLAQYGKIYDRLLKSTGIEAKEEYRAQLSALEKKIPKEHIQEYMQLFEEDLKVHLEIMNWAKEGLVDLVLIGIDDASSEGMPLVTKRKLEKQIEQNSLDNVYVMTGTDELTALLLARYKNEVLQTGSMYQVTYSDAEEWNRVLDYDAQPIQQIIEEKVRFLQPNKASALSAPLHIYVHSRAEPITKVEKWAKEQQRYIKGVADIAQVNRADKEWMEHFFRLGLDRQIESYAAWNTGGNTLGLLMAHMELIKDQHTWNEAHQKWVMTRYLEDYFYYAQLRPLYTEKYSTTEQLSVEEQQRLMNEVKLSTNQFITSRSFVSKKERVRFPHQPSLKVQDVQLPWGRMFEIEFFLQDKGAK